MGRLLRLAAGALVALCMAVCVLGGASASAAAGGKSIAEAPALKTDTLTHGELYDGFFYSGFSVAFWTASFEKGDHIKIVTDSKGDDVPPCQLLYMPGTDDGNVGATTPLLDPASSTRDGTHDVQRFVTATETGTYVLAMSNADIFLSGPLQCLSAPAGRPFTFKVTVAHRGGGVPSKQQRGGGGKATAPASGAPKHQTATYVVAPGESLWTIASGIVGDPFSIARIAFETNRLWRLNTLRIGTGNPDLIFPGQAIRLK